MINKCLVTDSKQQVLTPQLNHISLKLPSFPLLSGRDSLNSSMVCDESTVKNCEKQYCECTHIVQVSSTMLDANFNIEIDKPILF